LDTKGPYRHLRLYLNNSVKIKELMREKYLIYLFVIILTGCLPSVSRQGTPETPTERKTTTVEDTTKMTLSLEEQRKASLEVFKKVLEIREKGPLTPESIKKIEALYQKIIKEYPQSPLTEESYVYLIILYLRDYKPPQLDRAERTYKEFIMKYPSSSVRNRIESLLSTYYYSKKMWKRIIEIHYHRIRRFIETGKIDNPYFLYIYSEAKLHLGDIEEAEKGYRWVIKLAPGTNTAVKAQARLKQIKRQQNK